MEVITGRGVALPTHEMKTGNGGALTMLAIAVLLGGSGGDQLPHLTAVPP